jgi:hypothetical protein
VHAAGGDIGSFTVSALAGCAWTATAGAGWIHTTSSGNGSGTVSYTVDANPNTNGRSGSIVVQGQTYTVSQAGSATNTPDPTLVGFLPGILIARRVELSGTTAFVTTDRFGLAAVNVANPRAPQFLGGTDLPFNGDYVALGPGRAYVTGSRGFFVTPDAPTGVAGLYVVDTSTPAQMKVLGRLETNGLSFKGIAVSGNYAYVGCGWSGLAVLNISNPTNPTVVRVVATDGYAMGVTVNNGYVYLAENGVGFSIWDVSRTPESPQKLTFATGVPAKEIDVVGNVAYLAQGNALQIVDVSNKTAPALRGQCVVTGSNAVLQVRVLNGVAYVAGSAGGLITMSVANPAAPTFLGSSPAVETGNARALGVAVSGSWAYVANYDSGLVVSDVSTPSAPARASIVSAQFEVSKLVRRSGLVFATGTQSWRGGVTNVTSGLHVFDVQNPGAPRVLGSLNSGDLSFKDFAVAGDYAYVGCGWSGLAVISLVDPANPTVVRVVPTDGYAMSVTVSSGFAYVSENGVGFSIWNVASTPDNPTNRVFVPGVPAKQIEVVGNLAYLAQGNALQIVDVSDKLNPVLLGQRMVTGSNAVLQVKVQGSVAYVAGSAGGVILMNVANPAAPSWLASVPSTNTSNSRCLGVAVWENWVFSANYDAGLAIIDASDPARPRLHKCVLTTGIANSVLVEGNWAYVADSVGGLNTVVF